MDGVDRGGAPGAPSCRRTSGPGHAVPQGSAVIITRRIGRSPTKAQVSGVEPVRQVDKTAAGTTVTHG